MSIISERDKSFLYLEILDRAIQNMGIRLEFLTSFHPQSDGQTEKISALLELY